MTKTKPAINIEAADRIARSGGLGLTESLALIERIRELQSVVNFRDMMVAVEKGRPPAAPPAPNLQQIVLAQQRKLEDAMKTIAYMREVNDDLLLCIQEIRLEKAKTKRR